jgi:hypothetical protein
MDSETMGKAPRGEIGAKIVFDFRWCLGRMAPRSQKMKPQLPQIRLFDAGAGIVASDTISHSAFLTDINMLIVNNDARQSKFGVIVASGNTQGAVIRNNDGINLIDGITTNVTDHSIPECDESSGCR